MALIGVTFRLFTFCMIVISTIVYPIIQFLFLSKHKRLNKTTNQLFTQSATQLARKIRHRQVTCYEVVSTFITRLKEVNKILNAFVDERFEDALNEAKGIDDMLSSGQYNEDEIEQMTPLLGVPITIKQNLSIKGFSMAVGSKKRSGIKAKEDGDCVTLVKKAGAIIVCSTNTPEYCFSMECNNLIVGRTKNPFNTSRTSGGSSGGEGALIGSGASVCGLGSDIAGSIRIPSSFNGIFGHKPSPGVISLKGHFPVSDDPMFYEHLTIGPMTRYAEDLPLLTKVIANGNADKLNLNEPVDLSKIKVLFMEDCGGCFGLLSVEDAIKDAIHQSVQHLVNYCGSDVDEMKFIEMQYSAEMSLIMHFGIKNVPTPLDEDDNLYIEFIKSIFNASRISYDALFYLIISQNKSILPGCYDVAENYVKQFKKKMLNMLGINGIFLYPSFPCGAPPHGGSIYASVGTMYPLIMNVLGLPSTNVPVGFNKEGLPIGIQVVAAPYQDRLCFAVAKELETLFGGWKAPY